MKQVAKPAAPPMPSMRRPESSAWRPVNRLMLAPTANRPSAVSATDSISAPLPLPKRKGSKGSIAPAVKAANDELAATQGEPSV